jgi:hypothetical protein
MRRCDDPLRPRPIGAVPETLCYSPCAAPNESFWPSGPDAHAGDLCGCWHRRPPAGGRPGPRGLAARSGGRSPLGGANPVMRCSNIPGPPWLTGPRPASRSCQSKTPPRPWRRSPQRPEHTCRARSSGGGSSLHPALGQATGDRTATRLGHLCKLLRSAPSTHARGGARRPSPAAFYRPARAREGRPSRGCQPPERG